MSKAAPKKAPVKKTAVAKPPAGTVRVTDSKGFSLNCPISEVDSSQVAKPDIVITQQSKDHLKSLGFEFDWLKAIAKTYKFDSFNYIEKFCAFHCVKDGRHVEWIDVNTLALLNGRQMLCTILNKHQPLGKSRKIIKLPWEKL